MVQLVVSALAQVKKKLREARFFLGHMRREEQIPRRDPEHFEHYLSAFLSAARSVAFKVAFATGGTWAVVDEWKKTRTNADDPEFFDAMTDLRDSEVHNDGVTVSTSPERVPMPVGDSPHATMYAWFAAHVSTGMLGSTEIYIDRHLVNLADKPVEAVKAGERLVELLEDLLHYVSGLTTKEQR